MPILEVMRDIRVATVQFQHEPGNKVYNLGRLRHFVSEAAQSATEIVVFPEMCLTGYWHVRKLTRASVEALAEPVPGGPSTQELLYLSLEHGMTIGAGLIERGSDGRLYNAYVVAMPLRWLWQIWMLRYSKARRDGDGCGHVVPSSTNR